MSETKKILSEILSQINDLELVEKEFSRVELNKEKLKSSIDESLKKLEKKNREIEELSGFSFGGLVTSIFKDKKKLLEFKHDEYYKLSQHYDSLKNEMSTIDFEYNILSKKLNDLLQLKQKLKALMEKRENELLSENSQQGNTLNQIIDDISEKNTILEKTQRAIKIIDKLFTKLTLFSAALREVEGYSSWKTRRTRRSSYERNTAINNAKEFNIESKLLLNNLDNALRDIGNSIGRIDLRIIDFESYLGVLFDNIFSDLIIKKRVSEAVVNVESVYQKLKLMKYDLENNLKDYSEKISRLKQVKTKIILE